MRRRVISGLLMALAVVLSLAIASSTAFFTYRTLPVPAERHRATVEIKPPSTVQDSASAVNLFIADVGEEIEADSMVEFVLDKVPELDRETYLAGIEAERRGITSLVDLSFVHADPVIAEQTVDLVSHRLLDDAAKGDFERSRFLLNRATKRLEDAEQAMDEFLRDESMVDPEFEYRNALNQVAQLDQQIAAAETLTNTDTATDTDTDTDISELWAERYRIQSDLPGLSAAVLEYRRLATNLEQAQSAWQQAMVNNDTAAFDYRAVNTLENLITNRSVAPFVDDNPRQQRTALAGVVALTLALLIVTPMANSL
ncbi:MAG TPA: hypothetical protein VHM94_08605, partial [Acidimicrobiia bacterium]|nr:hypothetical protein [Acidimicrobiia bacterium]